MTISSKEISKTKKCLSTGEIGDRKKMLRFVVAPDMTLTLDLAEKLPGRGFWVNADKKALENIGKAAGFINRKAGSQGAKIPKDLPALVENTLCGRIKNLFGLCQKANLLTVGFKKTAVTLREKRFFSALIIASDAAEGSINELRLEMIPTGTKIIDTFSMEKLSFFVDTESLGCVGLLQNKLSDELFRDINRYCLLLGLPCVQNINSTGMATKPQSITSILT